MRKKQGIGTYLLWKTLSTYNRQVQMYCPNAVEQLASTTNKTHRGPN